MRPRRISDEQILEAMRHNVLAHGPQVSLELVAKDLQVTAPALLKRFGTRQELLLAALRPPNEPAWVRETKQGPSGESLQHQLEGLLGRIADFLRETLPCVMALRESGLPIDCIYPKPATPEVALAGLRHWLELAAKKGLVKAAELDAASYAMLGAVQTRVLFAHLLKKKHSPRAERTYLAELAHFFTRALATRSNKSN
jgi:AcrR family transcriptional regulator